MDYPFIEEIEAKSIYIKRKRTDSWFISGAGMNLYRGCPHNCVYCDGRSEKYYVLEEFGKHCSVKINAYNLLKTLFEKMKKKGERPPGYIFIGGGVGDSYNPVEKKYELTRSILDLVLEHGFPIHLITKSNLIERDIDLIGKINEKSSSLVSFSFSTTDDKLGGLIEPGASLPSERLESLRLMKQAGIPAGVMMMPILPLITDSYELMESAFSRFSHAGADYVIMSGMTLKPGRQKNYFYDFLNENFPQFLEQYRSMYPDTQYGVPKGPETEENYKKQVKNYVQLIGKYSLPPRIPYSLYCKVLDRKNLAIVMLEQLEYFLYLKGKKSSYSYAAYQLSKLKENLGQIVEMLETENIQGIGSVTRNLLEEINRTGDLDYYHFALDQLTVKKGTR